MHRPILADGPELGSTLSALAPARRRDVELARAVAAAAGDLLLRHAVDLAARDGQRTLAARRKPDGSLVTAADLAADRLIAAQLRAARPGDAILSEESTTRFGGGRTWVVDPLDGTTNFAAGLGVWGVTMALLEDGVPVVGVSAFPRLGLDFTAVAGGGAFAGTARLGRAARSGADGPAELGADDLVAQCSRTAAGPVLDLAGTRRSLGSTAYHLAMVASGTCRASITAAAGIWDVAAGWLLVLEAGGAVSDRDGGTPWPLAVGEWSERRVETLAAADPAGHAALRRALGGGSARPFDDPDGVRTAA